MLSDKSLSAVPVTRATVNTSSKGGGGAIAGGAAPCVGGGGGGGGSSYHEQVQQRDMAFAAGGSGFHHSSSYHNQYQQQQQQQHPVGALTHHQFANVVYGDNPATSHPYGSHTIEGLPASVPLRIETLARPRPYTGPSSEVVLAMRQQHLSAGQYHFYEEPLMLVEGNGQYCFDEKGRAYLDAYSNVAHVGHCHPVHVRALSQAAGEILSNTRYLHPYIVEFTSRLKEKVPASLSVVYLVNSGSEANDLAMRLARCHTKRKKMACLSGAYHGTTFSCSGVSTSLSVGTKEGSSDFEYASQDVVVLPAADPYRGKFRGDDPQAAKNYVEWSKDIIQTQTGEENIAGFITEAIQGVAGQVVFPPGYLRKMFKYIRSIGGVCIADEVQTGFARCGSNFWAFEAQDATPDILVLGKPIGSGFPLGAVICTREISRSFDATKYFNTFGGNPLACAAGLAVLNIIERDNMQENAFRVGAHFIHGLQALQQRYEIIGDVRGVGTFIGMELVRDRATLEPASQETAHIMEECRKHGILVGKGGVHNNVIRFKPPLCFTCENADTCCQILDKVLLNLDATMAFARREGGAGSRRGSSERERSSYVHFGAPNSATASVQRGAGGNRSKKNNYYNNSDENDDDDDKPTTITSPRIADRYLERNIYETLRSSREENHHLFHFGGGQRAGNNNFSQQRTNATPRQLVRSDIANESSTLRDIVRQSLRDDDRTMQQQNRATSTATAAGPMRNAESQARPTNNNNVNNSNNFATPSLMDAVRRSLRGGGGGGGVGVDERSVTFRAPTNNNSSSAAAVGSTARTMRQSGGGASLLSGVRHPRDGDGDDDSDDEGGFVQSRGKPNKQRFVSDRVVRSYVDGKPL